MKALRVRVNYTAPAPWRQFKFIQNDDLKDLSPEAKQRLRESVISKEFVQPFYVWKDPAGEIYCLDGRHRTLILEELIGEGYDIPELLPANFIDCKDKKEAAELVLVYSSMYAKMNADGLHKFLSIYEMDWENLNAGISIPELNMDMVFGEMKRDFASLNQELEIDQFTDEVIMKLRYSKEEYLNLKASLQKLMESKQIESMEKVIQYLVKNSEEQ